MQITFSIQPSIHELDFITCKKIEEDEEFKLIKSGFVIAKKENVFLKRTFSFSKKTSHESILTKLEKLKGIFKDLSLVQIENLEYNLNRLKCLKHIQEEEDKRFSSLSQSIILAKTSLEVQTWIKAYKFELIDLCSTLIEKIMDRIKRGEGFSYKEAKVYYFVRISAQQIPF